MKRVNIHEAKTHFSRLIQEVMSGSSFVIAKAGTPVGMLVPCPRVGKNRVAGGSWAGKVKISEDFDRLPKDVEDSFYGD